MKEMLSCLDLFAIRQTFVLCIFCALKLKVMATGLEWSSLSLPSSVRVFVIHVAHILHKCSFVLQR